MTDRVEALKASIRAAFEAGCAQGSDEATAYEWGSRPNMSRDQAFADFMSDWEPDSAPLRELIAQEDSK